MKRLFGIMLALVMCLSMTAVAETPKFYSPRDTALDLVQKVNESFVGYEGAIWFDEICADEESWMMFGSSEAAAVMVAEYPEALPGLRQVYFSTNDINEVIMCASMAYYCAEMFYGSETGLYEWLNEACLQMLMAAEAGEMELTLEYPLTKAEFIMEFRVEDSGDYSFSIGVDCEYAMLISDSAF